MAHETLLAKIDAAKKAISDAESELQDVISKIAVVARADKTGVSEAVQAASSKLSDARATLDELEESMVRAKIDAAKAAINDAEKHLDKVLRELVAVPGEDTTWSKVVRDAFTKLKLANATLADLHSSVTDED